MGSIRIKPWNFRIFFIWFFFVRRKENVVSKQNINTFVISLLLSLCTVWLFLFSGYGIPELLADTLEPSKNPPEILLQTITALSNAAYNCTKVWIAYHNIANFPVITLFATCAIFLWLKLLLQPRRHVNKINVFLACQKFIIFKRKKYINQSGCQSLFHGNFLPCLVCSSS